MIVKIKVNDSCTWPSKVVKMPVTKLGGHLSSPYCALLPSRLTTVQSFHEHVGLRQTVLDGIEIEIETQLILSSAEFFG